MENQQATVDTTLLYEEVIVESVVVKDGAGRMKCMKNFVHYWRAIRPNKVVLWCYLIWYISTVYFYFDPAPKLWINSLGISAVIGTGLLFSVSARPGNPPDYWQTFRLYLMPFCVSSFSALIKDQGFWIVISPKVPETLTAGVACLLFLVAVFLIKQLPMPRV